MLSSHNLGLIPSWQFNPDPSLNPLLTPYMQMPAGTTQSTVQPIGPYSAYGWRSSNGVAGVTDINNVFDSWWWKNRKWLAFGGIAVLGVGLIGGLTAILR